MDLKNIFENKAAEFGWEWSYGNRNNHNLLAAPLDPTKIFLLMDSPRRRPNHNKYGGENGMTYTGSFMVVMHSDYDRTYDKQRGNDESKFEDHISPIIKNNLPQLFHAVVCDNEFEINASEIIEIINALNANMDGVLVTYTITEL